MTQEEEKQRMDMLGRMDAEHFEFTMSRLGRESFDQARRQLIHGKRCLPYLDQDFVFACVVHCIAQEVVRRTEEGTL